MRKFDEEFTCDYVRYLAPPRPRRRQWFVRRFDREPVLREFPKQQKRKPWGRRECRMVCSSVIRTPHASGIARRRTTAEDGCWEWCCWWVSGLGIGFWLRGVQPWTTMR